jgi:hypothetical protein
LDELLDGTGIGCGADHRLALNWPEDFNASHKNADGKRDPKQEVQGQEGKEREHDVQYEGEAATPT